MENLDGKYFEKVISELKEMKAREDFNIDAQFRANLRAKIIERSMGVSNGFAWGSFVSKWKYVFGLVPTMAVMAIVAINMSNYQVKMKSVDYVGNAQPTSVVGNSNTQNSIKEITKNDLFVADKLPIESVDNNTPKIVTFSAELALPSAEVLLAHQNQQRSFEPMTQPKQQDFNFQLNLPELKIKNPNLEVSSFVFGEQIPKNYVPNSFVPQVIVQPSFPVVTFVPKQVVTSTQVNIQPAKTVPVDTIQTNTIQPIQDNIVQNTVIQNADILVQPVNINTTNNSLQAPVVANEVNTLPLTIATPILTPTSKVVVPEAKVLSVPVSADLIPTTQNFVDQTQLVLPVRSDAKIVTPVVERNPALVLDANVNEFFNPVLESQQTMTRMMIAPVNGSLNSVVEAVSGSVQTDRIRYSGRNMTEVYSAILSNFANLNGGLSSDYYIDAVTLESGTIKVSLFEYGRVKRIVFLKEINGEFRNVTEINY